MVQGEVDIFSDDPDHALHNNPVTIEGGAYFGEMSIVLKTLRVAGARCKTPCCVLLSISTQNFHAFFSRFQELLSEFELRVFHEKITLQQIVHNPQARMNFREFLESEHAAESLLFWQDTEAFRLTDPKDSSGSTSRGKFGTGVVFSSRASFLQVTQTGELDQLRADHAAKQTEDAEKDEKGEEGEEGEGEGEEEEEGEDELMALPEASSLKDTKSNIDSKLPGPENYWTNDEDEDGTPTPRGNNQRKSLVPDFKSLLDATKAASFCMPGKKDQMQKNRVSKLQVLCAAIYSKYISADADLMVNIGATKVTAIKAAIDAGSVDVNLFLDAQAEVFKMMQKDNFVRYQKSKQFEALGEKMGFYKKQDKGTQEQIQNAAYNPQSKRWSFSGDLSPRVLEKLAASGEDGTAE